MTTITLTLPHWLLLLIVVTLLVSIVASILQVVSTALEHGLQKRRLEVLKASLRDAHFLENEREES